jgi:tRNA uridine 5-carboxymethylaminomethyl modification enzyme
VNAALKSQGKDGWCPRRDEAYLGVLVDDLTTQGVSEPYRMFTSRAEYRLQLREDNADMRLTEQGRALGLVDDARWDAFNRKRDSVSRETERLKSTWVNPALLSNERATALLGTTIEREYSLFDLLRRPGVTFGAIDVLRSELSLKAKSDQVETAPADGVENPALAGGSGGAGFATQPTMLDESVAEQVEIAAKYAGYIERQQDEIDRQLANENLRFPADLDYTQVRGLSKEVQIKLSAQRPETLGQAGRISGVTPAAISLLLVHLKKGRLAEMVA